MSGGKIGWIIVLVSVILMVWLKQRSLVYQEEDQLSLWLKENRLEEIEESLVLSGIKSTRDLLKYSVDSLSDTLSLTSEQVWLLDRACSWLKVQNWLLTNELTSYEPVLKQHSMISLRDLTSTSDKDLYRMMEGQKDKDKFIAAVTSLRNESHSSYSWIYIIIILFIIIIALIVFLYICVVNVVNAAAVLIIDTLMYGIVLVLWVLIVGVVGSFINGLTGRRVSPPNPPSFSSFRTRTAASRGRSRFSLLRTNQTHSRANTNSTGADFHLGLYDRLVGKSFDSKRSSITWNNQESLVVGNSSIATVHFKCRNDSNYTLQPSDNLSIKILHVSSKTTLPHALEPARPFGQDSIKISFTPKLSGSYNIDIKINGTYIGRDGSIIRQYKPGSVDASKTVFLQQSNTIVVTSGLYHSMQIIPKDRFGNPANVCQEYLTAEIRKDSSTGDLINPECVVDTSPVPNQYEILLKVEEVGYFVGCVKYEGEIIGPCSINIISLNEADSVSVDKNVDKKCNVYYESTYTPGAAAKPKKVYCYISPKQIQVKEFFILGLIPKRIYSCKVCPSTRIIFHETAECFTLDDGYQSPLVMVSPHREVLAATFYKFLLKNIGGSEKFQDKQKFFYSEVKKMRSQLTRGEVHITVSSRHSLLEEAIQATKHLSGSDWYKKFTIDFQGEEGLDWGGVSREFFELVCVRCFDPSYQLFKRFSDNPQGLAHPNPNRPSHLKLRHYEFAGRIVGKCLYESALGNQLMVKARFSRSFLAQIIGLRINHKYFESDNPELYTTKIQYIRDNDVTDLGLVFAEEEIDQNTGTITVVPLISKGEEIEVTNSNKLQYLNLLAQHKLSKTVKEEVDHFLKGLNDVISDHLLSIFDETELELLMCGVGTVSYNELKVHTVVNGSNDRFRTVVSWFWTLVSGFTQEEMAKLLQFVTGCSQLPPGGFKDLHPAFQIISSPTHGRLPTAHTCFNQLCLPSYDSYDQFQQSLTLALNEGSEGFGFA